ncbi:MAG: Uma2 family endonuclease [Methylococcales bacterium]
MAVTDVLQRMAREASRRLPTMYDLPSEDPEEPGLPDDFHYFQPQLLRESFSSPKQASDQIYIGTDINLYFDPSHPLWHKRPDWFLVIDAPKLYRQRELRLSYVVWDEPKAPYLVVELLSPGTEKEDLGETEPHPEGEPPGKWEVYERLLKIPYYVLYDRYVNRLRAFHLSAGRYRALTVPEDRLWLPKAGLGLGLWTGCYEQIEGTWLRWYDAGNHWLATAEEKLSTQRQCAEKEHQRAEQADQRAEQERQRTKQADQRANEADQRAKDADQRAEQERQRAEQERQRAELADRLAEQERQRARRLTEQLKALGIDPESQGP